MIMSQTPQKTPMPTAGAARLTFSSQSARRFNHIHESLSATLITFATGVNARGGGFAIRRPRGDAGLFAVTLPVMRTEGKVAANSKNQYPAAIEENVIQHHASSFRHTEPRPFLFLAHVCIPPSTLTTSATGVKRARGGRQVRACVPPAGRARGDAHMQVTFRQSRQYFALCACFSCKKFCREISAEIACKYPVFGVAKKKVFTVTLCVASAIPARERGERT